MQELGKDCSLEDLLLHLKLQLYSKMSASPGLVSMIKQEAKVYSVSSMWEIIGISYIFFLEIP